MKDREVEKLGNHLDNKKIGIMVSSGIAAYKTPSLIRHFRQYGADVTIYLTPEAERFVGREALVWASGKGPEAVISTLTSQAEHLRELDAYIAAPATYNTINKFANGTADNAVTTLFASALGRMEMGFSKILLAPTMHGTMTNSIYQESLEKLIGKGIDLIPPKEKWGKLNLPSSHNIVYKTIRTLSESSLKEKNILITAGPTPGYLDNVRMLVNRFRGRTGIAIAEEAYLRGANITLLLGATGYQAPDFLNAIKIKDFEQYRLEVENQLANKEYDAGIFSAAVSDYIPKNREEGKIPSGKLNSVELAKTPKIIQEVRANHPNLYMVTFKYQERMPTEELHEIAKGRIKQGYQMVVANRGEDMNEQKHLSYIFDHTGQIAISTTKEELATKLLDNLEARL